MDKRIVIIAASLGLVVLMGVAVAVISSYGSITGAAIAKSAISWDIIETGSDVNGTATNDTYYLLEESYQGETKWIKIKIVNNANATIPVNVLVTGNNSEIIVSTWNDNKTIELTNPIDVPTTDIYIWLRHNISTNASPGSYEFSVNLTPA